MTPPTPVPSRWTLRTIRATFPWLHEYDLSSVWRMLRRWKLKLRSPRLQQFSPDAEYAPKVARLEQCLRAAAAEPERVVVIFLDEMGFTRWPEPAVTWSEDGTDGLPVAERSGTNNQQWRIIGGLNAWTGQVTYLDGNIVGRAKVIAINTWPRSTRRRNGSTSCKTTGRSTSIQRCWQPWKCCPASNRSGCRPMRRGSIPLRSCGAGCGKMCCTCIDWPATGPHCGNACVPFWISLPMVHAMSCSMSVYSAGVNLPKPSSTLDYRL